MKRHSENADREACAEKYEVWKCDMMNRTAGISMDLQTHVAVARLHSVCSSAAVNVNAQWAAFVSQSQKQQRQCLNRVIPFLAGSSNKAIGLALATAENAATGRTLIIKDPKESRPFTVTIFADDDELSSSLTAQKKDFEEASFLYREFGYAVPSVVIWAMTSCHDDAYTSISCDGAFTIRVGCQPSDICAYVGIDGAHRDSDSDSDSGRYRNELRQPEWQIEWNRLVEQLYSARYYELEKHFWNNKNIK